MDQFGLEDVIALLIGLAIFVALGYIVTYRAEIARFIMSRAGASPAPDRAVAAPVAGQSQEGGQRMAKPGNAVNASLPGNALPEEVREIIRYQQKVEDAVKIIQAGKIGQTEAIELIFECKRSGRSDSPYARARAAVQERIGPAPVLFYDDLKAKIEAEA